ncbi:MAG TPA: DUF177 domain-containing protein [Acholeplasma sp.]|jgi:uncharacterized metal-binding protein YceD (DUF177 family)|nr:DUF177 domain-containing protein [Acholeplasma sp.]
MKWSLQQLKKFNNEAYNFSYEPDLKHRALETHDVLDIKSLHVEGSIKEISFNRFEVLFTIKGVLVLEDAVTLEGIDYPIALECEEICDTQMNFEEDMYLIEKNTLDLDELVWINIILHKPMRVSNSD